MAKNETVRGRAGSIKSAFARERQKNVEELVDKLVQSFGIERETENYDIAVEFVSSNVNQHSFLDSDRHAITSTYDGIVDNLRAHSQGRKAAALQYLFKKLLQCETTGDNFSLHEDVLMLLFQLGQSPLHAAYVPAQVESIGELVEESVSSYEPEKECTILNAWLGDYLDDYDTDDDTDDESSESSDAGVLEEHVQASPQQLQARRKKKAQAVMTYPSVTLGGQKSAAFDLQNPCSLGSAYQKFVAQQTQFETATDLHVIPEQEIVEQAFWALQGVGGHCLILNKTEKGPWFGISEQVAVSHLSQAALHDILSRIAEVATMLAVARKQMLAVSSSGCRTCNTLDAFKASVNTVLLEFNCDLARLAGSATLLSLAQWLEEDPATPFLLQEVLVKAGLMQTDLTKLPRASMPTLASKLLSTLYLMADDEALLCHQPMRRHLLLRLFADSFVPYMTMLEQWLHLGQVQDPHGEFLVVEHIGEQATGGAATDQWSLRQLSQTPSRNQTNLNDRAHSGREVMPSFLRCVSKEVLVTGQAVQLLHIMGLSVSKEISAITKQRIDTAKVALVNARSTGTVIQRTLSRERLQHSSLVQNVEAAEQLHQNVLLNSPMPREPVHKKVCRGILSSQCQGSESEPDNGTLPPPPALPSTIPQFELPNVLPKELDFERTGLMKPPACMPGSSCAQNSTYLAAVSFCQKDFIRGESAPAVTADSFEKAASHHLSVPLESTLDTHLLGYVRQQHDLTNAAVLRVLIEECHLMSHLSAIRSFFFQAKGDALHDFTSALFAKLNDNIPLGSTYELNSLLQQSLLNTDTFGATLVSCEFEEDVCTQTGVDALAPVKLSYNAEWPLNLVITPACLAKYNRVFAFILQIKRSLFCLSQIYDWSKETPMTSSHSAQLFQAELRHFVNALNHYVMTRVVTTLWSEQKAKLLQARNLAELTALHAEYVDTVLRCCLLSTDGSQTRVMEFLLGILSLVLDFSAIYKEYLNSLGTFRSHEDDHSYHNDDDEEEDSAMRVASEPTPDREALSKRLAASLVEIKASFRQKHRLLLVILQKKIEKGRYVFLEDLYARLNFNNFYKT